MKAYRAVLVPARGALILLTLCVVFEFAIVYGLAYFRNVKKVTLAQTEGRLQATRAEIKTLTFDLASLEAHLMTFKHLTQVGLIGDPDREAWVQGLEAIHSGLHLPPTLSYTLAPPRALTDPTTRVAGVIPTAQTDALRHDLDIELSGIHEGEFLAFVDTLTTAWQTPFRIETCNMARKSGAGLQIKCTLQLFSLPLAETGQ